MRRPNICPYSTVQFVFSAAQFGLVRTVYTHPPPHSAPPLLLLLGSVLLSNIYKFNAKFVFEVQQIFNIP